MRFVVGVKDQAVVGSEARSSGERPECDRKLFFSSGGLKNAWEVGNWGITF